MEVSLVLSLSKVSFKIRMLTSSIKFSKHNYFSYAKGPMNRIDSIIVVVKVTRASTTQSCIWHM